LGQIINAVPENLSSTEQTLDEESFPNEDADFEILQDALNIEITTVESLTDIQETVVADEEQEPENDQKTIKNVIITNALNDSQSSLLLHKTDSSVETTTRSQPNTSIANALHQEPIILNNPMLNVNNVEKLHDNHNLEKLTLGSSTMKPKPPHIGLATTQTTLENNSRKQHTEKKLSAEELQEQSTSTSALIESGVKALFVDIPREKIRVGLGPFTEKDEGAHRESLFRFNTQGQLHSGNNKDSLVNNEQVRHFVQVERVKPNVDSFNQIFEPLALQKVHSGVNAESSRLQFNPNNNIIPIFQQHHVVNVQDLKNPSRSFAYVFTKLGDGDKSTSFSYNLTDSQLTNFDFNVNKLKTTGIRGQPEQVGKTIPNRSDAQASRLPELPEGLRANIADFQKNSDILPETTMKSDNAENVMQLPKTVEREEVKNAEEPLIPFDEITDNPTINLPSEKSNELHVSEVEVQNDTILQSFNIIELSKIESLNTEPPETQTLTTLNVNDASATQQTIETHFATTEKDVFDQGDDIFDHSEKNPKNFNLSPQQNVSGSILSDKANNDLSSNGTKTGIDLKFTAFIGAQRHHKGPEVIKTVESDINPPRKRVNSGFKKRVKATLVSKPRIDANSLIVEMPRNNADSDEVFPSVKNISSDTEERHPSSAAEIGPRDSLEIPKNVTNTEDFLLSVQTPETAETTDTRSSALLPEVEIINKSASQNSNFPDQFKDEHEEQRLTRLRLTSTKEVKIGNNTSDLNTADETLFNLKSITMEMGQHALISNQIMKSGDLKNSIIKSAVNNKNALKVVEVPNIDIMEKIRKLKEEVEIAKLKLDDVKHLENSRVKKVKGKKKIDKHPDLIMSLHRKEFSLPLIIEETEGKENKEESHKLEEQTLPVFHNTQQRKEPETQPLPEVSQVSEHKSQQRKVKNKKQRSRQNFIKLTQVSDQIEDLLISPERLPTLNNKDKLNSVTHVRQSFQGSVSSDFSRGVPIHQQEQDSDLRKEKNIQFHKANEFTKAFNSGSPLIDTRTESKFDTPALNHNQANADSTSQLRTASFQFNVESSQLPASSAISEDVPNSSSHSRDNADPPRRPIMHQNSKEQTQTVTVFGKQGKSFMADSLLELQLKRVKDLTRRLQSNQSIGKCQYIYC
jgi:hypothetical protein